jgi:hypothetical protein
METALMKLLGMIGTTGLLLLLGSTAAAYAARDGQEQGDKPEKQEEGAKPAKQEAKPAKQEQAKPAKQEAKQAKQEQAKPAKQDAKEAKQEQAKPAKQETKEAKQEQAKPAKQETKQAKQEQAKPAKQEAKEAKQEQAKPAKQVQAKPPKQEVKQAKQEQQDNHAQQKESTQQSQRDAGNRGGGEHGRISDDRYRASFGSGHNFHVNRGDYDHRRFNYGGYSFGFIDPWPVDWYYTDNVYVVYDDGGYYMYDVVHPGIRISVNIL